MFFVGFLSDYRSRRIVEEKRLKFKIKQMDQKVPTYLFKKTTDLSLEDQLSLRHSVYRLNLKSSRISDFINSKFILNLSNIILDYLEYNIKISRKISVIIGNQENCLRAKKLKINV